jgi:hypothetical protein
MRLTKKGTTNLIAVLNYSQAFRQMPPENPFDLLRKYPTDLIILRISKINAILYFEQETAIQNVRCLKEVIFEGVSTKDDLLAQIGLLMNRTHQGAFSAPVMSRIIKEVFENYRPVVPDQMVNPVVFAGDLLKAILAYNEHYYAGGPDLNSFEGLFSVDIKQQYYLRRERYLKLDLLLKFAFISKFLSEDDKLKQPALEYCQALQIGTVWGLARFFLFLFERLLSREKTANHILRRNGADWPVMEQFVLRKQDVSSGRKLSLHKDIIPKPLYEYDAEHLVILDYNYFTYGMDQGVLYSIFGKSSLRDKVLFKDFNAYKGYIGLHYFEQFYIGGFINHIFSKRSQRVISSEKYQDFIIRSGNDLFIVEVKMTDFNANGLENESFIDFKKFIDENFLNFKEEGQGKNKGLAQVLRQVDYLVEDNVVQQQLGLTDLKKLTIYPVLIYADANLDMNGVNEYINEKFPAHIEPYTSFFQRIRPVVMINGTFFMLYYRHLRKNPALFAKWLDAYIKSVSTMKKRYQTDRDVFQYLMYNKSFAEHMRRKLPNEELGPNLDIIQNDFELEVKDFGKDFKA